MKYILILLVSFAFGQVENDIDNLVIKSERIGMKTYRLAVNIWAIDNQLSLDMEAIDNLYKETKKEIEEIVIEQETDTTLKSQGYDPIPLSDFALESPADKCFQILLQFQEGWLDKMFDMRDSLICPNMIDVRINHEGIIKDYTMDEFLERLGFKE